MSKNQNTNLDLFMLRYRITDTIEYILELDIDLHSSMKLDKELHNLIEALLMTLCHQYTLLFTEIGTNSTNTAKTARIITIDEKSHLLLDEAGRALDQNSLKTFKNIENKYSMSMSQIMEEFNHVIEQLSDTPRNPN